MKMGVKTILVEEGAKSQHRELGDFQLNQSTSTMSAILKDLLQNNVKKRYSHHRFNA